MRAFTVICLSASLYLAVPVLGGVQHDLVAPLAAITIGDQTYQRIPNTTAIIDPAIKNTQHLTQRTRAVSLREDQTQNLGIPGTFILNLPPEQLAAAQIAFAYTSPVFQGNNNTIFFPAPHILLGFTDKPENTFIQNSLQAHKLTGILSTKQIDTTGVATLAVDATDGNQVIALARDLARSPLIAFAEPDMIFQGSPGASPNDPFFTTGNLWGLHNTGQFGGTPDIDLNAPEAWDITTGSPSTIVVVIDSGVQLNHPDLIVSFGNDFTSDASTDGSPFNAFENHGTEVAGCVNATSNNSLGSVGIAPNISLASARTFIAVDPSGAWTSFSSWTVDTLNWAVSIGARVTVNSNSYGFSSIAIDTAYNTTRSINNIVHYASAGNNGNTTGSNYPGMLSSVNAIGAIDRDGNLASFSNWGFNVTLFAPGVSIVTTDRTSTDGSINGDFVFVNGTSYAAPYVGGVAALVISRFPTLSAAEVETKIRISTKDLGVPGIDSVFQNGLPDAFSALQIPCFITTNLAGDPNIIDGGDLGTLLGLWGPVSSPDADFNDDGFVDGADLGLLLSQWGTCP
jgi:subtilisin family serine protease